MKDEHMVITLRTGSKDPVPEPSVTKAQPLQRKSKRGVFGFIALLILLGGGAGFYILSKHPTLLATLTAQSSSTTTSSQSPKTDLPSQDETTRLVAEVGALIELPQHETPTVATVTDPSKLNNQQFFANAKVGDVVLMYTQAHKAYLYDPKAKKLIEVAPITNQTP